MQGGFVGAQQLRRGRQTDQLERTDALVQLRPCRAQSKANRDAFAADPARYAPQYGGFCAFGMAGGYKAAGDPVAFSVVDGKLYLNYNRDVQKQWTTDVPGFVSKADRNWPAVSNQTEVHE